MLRTSAGLACLVAAFVALPRAQTEKLDYAAIGQIRDEALNRSQAMDTLFWLTDRYGPRVTGSPAMEEAGAWTMKRMADWGLANVHREEFDFGRSWSVVRFSAHLTEPRVQPLIGLPKTWSTGTDGPVTADVVRATIASEADLAKYKGRLKGKIVLAQPARAVRMLEGPFIVRMDGALAREAETTPVPAPRGQGGRGAAPAPAAADDTPGEQPGGRGRGGAGTGQGNQQFLARVQQFYKDEGVVAVFDRGSDADTANMGSGLSVNQQRPDGGTLFPGTVSRTAPHGVPQVTLAVEHYNRMVRLLEHDVPVKVDLDVRVQFHDNTRGFNIVGDIPGSDLANEVVMLGAHFDSHSFATGATDNATGTTAMLEALRVIRGLGLKPRRTIRVALWGGEEQGLLGSRAYVLAHFADPQTMAIKPEHARLSAYFNLDNGTGRIRGIWMQGNLAVRPIFAEWIAPLADLGVTILGPRSVASTDHSAFDAVGLPAFQFVQDRLEYNSRTHHSNMDTYDRVQRDDLVQQATVAAVFAYNAAMRDEKLPRKALPRPQGRGARGAP
ncbi:MAG TPA: M20/M25/M40 family metallo-hydrolase [Vicinamibacterales bacterium]|nr:M20/M25/M40 family metallo-hydrolase [Vicinamibacterales bacterium]